MKTCIHKLHEGDRELEITEFGISKGRRDGLNLYCKKCCRETTNAGRQAKAEMRLAQKFARNVQRKENRPVRMVSHPPEIRVLQAIKRGAKTQDEIEKQTRLFPDQLGDVLVKLILVEKKVGSRISGDEREYFVKEAA